MTKRTLLIAALSLALLGGSPHLAWGDITAFLGASPTPVRHSARGFSLGVSLLVVGFEGEYATLSHDVVRGAPGLRTGSINGMIQTPTRTQLYVTTGVGFYREELGAARETNLATNIGGGVKIGLIGPLRLRLDYRVFHLRGTPIASNVQRFYAGANLAF
ncbi:MAG: hypothetical protein ABI051_06265 [Vicinamibacterales bacterium]